MIIGKLTSDDLLILLEVFPTLERQYNEISVLLREKPEKFFTSGYVKPSWFEMYEKPYLEHIAQIVILMGEVDNLREMAASVNPTKAGIDQITRLMADESVEPFEDEDQPYILLMLGYAASIYFTLKSLLTFGIYLNDLVAMVGQGGKAGDKALLRTLKIDPTAISCTDIINRISHAVLEKDQSFLKKVQKALSGKLTKREDRTYQGQRLVLQVLLESESPKLSQDELYQLFVEELKIVARDREGDIGDVANNLRQFAYQFMKQKSVSQN